jgi:hypothetical protein
MSLIKLYVILGMDEVAKIIECHDFRIISSLSNTGELLVLESILISKLKRRFYSSVSSLTTAPTPLTISQARLFTSAGYTARQTLDD